MKINHNRILQKLFFLTLRKIRSVILRAQGQCFTAYCYASAIGNPAITFATGCTFGRSVRLEATDGGVITLGRNVSVADRVQIVTLGGTVEVGDGVFIGAGTVIVARENIVIGKDSLIAEYVVIRDQDHQINTRPLIRSGFYTSPINIGSDVWIGAKASILRGASVGNRCVIGAHALLKSHIPDDTLAAGVPARVIKRLESEK